MSVPLIRFFYPDPDPTEEFPKESADVEGYVLAPDRLVTVAAVAGTPKGVEMLDSVWATLRRKGVGRRRLVLLDDRGRTVSVMTVQIPDADDSLRYLRSSLVVPIHARGGFAEVHLLASPEEAEVIAGRIEKDGPALSVPSEVVLPPARETGALVPEDWAFLGLLSCVGAFDGPEGPSPELLAELLGVDPGAFAEKARAVERGLGDVVSGLFAPTGPEAPSEGLPP